MADGIESGPLFVWRHHLELLVDAVEEYAIFGLDPSGRVATWNPGAERIKGYTAGEIVGQHFSMFYPERERADGKPARSLAVAAEVGSFKDEGWRVRKDGTMFWASVVITAVHETDGRLAGFAKVTRDDTDRKAVELAATNATFAAVEANAAKDRFLSRMSHELRTPLNTILGFGQLMQMDDLAHAHLDGISHIIGAGQHLLALIDDVLDISGVESGESRLSLEPVRVAGAVEEAVGMLQPLSESRHVPILMDDIEQGLYVWADRHRLTQVVLNLVSNAIKYTDHDHGEVRLVAKVEDDGRIRLSVIDHGPGIAAEDVGRLFQPFERLAATQAGIDGTGLGLTLSKTLITAMSGEIGVISEPGRGSTFWIDLPSTDAAHVALPPSLTTHPRPNTNAAPATTVLCIEDNPSNILLLERIFARRPSVTMVVATYGAAGIAAALEHQPDLILLDLHLPDMSGDEVLRRLRGEPKTASTPIVIVTADATEGSPKRLHELGATGFLTKPFEIERVLELIDDGAHDWSPPSDHTGARSRTNPDAYIADFVHDLNNALTLIANYSTIVAHTTAEPATRADMTHIQRAADAATQHVRALLEHSRDQPNGNAP